MKFYSILFFALFSTVYGQKNNFEITHFITKDSIYIKWVPTNYKNYYNLLTLDNEVYFTDKNETSLSKVADIKIDAFSTRLTGNKFDRIKYERSIDILDGILKTHEQDSSSQKYAFAMASIESALNLEINKIAGNVIIFPRNKFKDKIIIQLKIGETITIQNIPIATSILPEPSTLAGKIDKKKIATLHWDAQVQNASYLGYIIERKVGNGNFEPILQQPFVDFKTNFEKEDRLASYRDEIVEQGKSYSYRITGINYFGFQGPHGKEVKVYIPILTNAILEIDTISANGFVRNIEISISKEDESKPFNLKKMMLLRSDSLLGEYKVIGEIKNPKNKEVFSLQMEKLTGEGNYYKLLGLSQDNDTANSAPYYFFTLDQEPPGIITNLTGKIDSLGIVSLTWTSPSDKDLLGYRIYRSNAKHEEFVEITTQLSLTTSYFDTLNLNSLSNEVYYFGFAVDKNYNQGNKSDTILLIKPDTIPPSTPFIIQLKKKKDNIFIEWENSFSTDIKKQYLIRSNQLKTDTLLVFNDTTSFYLDSTYLPSKTNIYKLIAEDIAGNKTMSEARSFTLEPGYRPTIKNIHGVSNKSSKCIDLSWDKPDFKVYQYYIYRKKGKNDFKLIKTLSGENLNGKITYTDKELEINNDYEYIIQYITEDGFRSLKNTPIKIRY